jgi:hypothetical protein
VYARGACVCVYVRSRAFLALLRDRGDRGWWRMPSFFLFFFCMRSGGPRRSDTIVVTQRADADRVLDRVPVPARGRAYPSTSAPARVGTARVARLIDERTPLCLGSLFLPVDGRSSSTSLTTRVRVLLYVSDTRLVGAWLRAITKRA